MSLATACPSCNTVFRVLQDQLKASEGWVRCGHCHKVFNALEHLFDLESRRAFSDSTFSRRQVATAPSVDMSDPAWQETAPAAFSNESLLRQMRANRPAPVPATGNTLPPRAPVSAPAAPLPAPPAPAVEEMPLPKTVVMPRPSMPLPPAVSTEVMPRTDAAAPAPISIPGAYGEIDLTDSRLFATTAMLAHDEPHDPLMSYAPGAEPSPEPVPPPGAGHVLLRPEQITGRSNLSDLPGFMREADRRARWQRPWVRAGLGLIGVLLLGALAAQASYQMRDRIAARWPQTLPLLRDACRQLGCEIQAPRQIDAIVVDNTALTRPPGVDGYRLSVMLRNRADHIVAAPHLELNLTDTTGAIVVRKVFSPADFQLSQTELAALSDVTWTLAFQVTGQQIAGYTLSAFYP